MSIPSPSVPIGIYGIDKSAPRAGRGWGLWTPGIEAAVTAAGGVAVQLPPAPRAWPEALEGIHGVVFLGVDRPGVHPGAEEAALLSHCRQRRLPLLAIDHGLLTLNAAFGGTVYLDLARDLP